MGLVSLGPSEDSDLPFILPEPQPIVVDRQPDGGVVLALPAWPLNAAIDDSALERLDTRYARLVGPGRLSFTFANAEAVYLLGESAAPLGWRPARLLRGTVWPA